MTNTESFPPTAEQTAITTAFATGENMLIEAGAGTGKTSTLQMVAETCPERQGTFVVYNKAAQLDAKASFPDNVDCRTAHSLAYGGMMRQKDGKQITARAHKRESVPSGTLVGPLGIPSGYESGDQFIPAWVIASAAVAAVRNYANSADDEITAYHVPPQDGVENQADFKAFVAPFAKKVWADVQKPNGFAKVTPDHYLKMWALTRPDIKGEFIMLDEAQDTNPVLLKVIADQTQQQVIVGDRCQQLYAWRGAVNAMTDFEATHNLCLSQSFRFGPAIAQNANKFLDLLRAPLRLIGFDKIDSKIADAPLTDPDAILCRTNATVIQHAMVHQAKDKRVAIVGGTMEIEMFTKGARDLMDGRSAGCAELAAFNSWSQVQAYAGTDEGADMRVKVKLITDYGVEDILAVCAASVNEKTADIIVTTAHKSKGREWNSVKIAEDFEPPKEGNEPSHADLCLSYVAVTRAKLVLDPGSLVWINSWNDGTALEPGDSDKSDNDPTQAYSQVS